MPDVDYTTLPALLPIKLETALVKWLRAKRGSLMSGVNITGAHEPGVPPVPWLSVFCRGAHKHPDFAGVTGAHLPKLATLELSWRVHRELDFQRTASLWSGQCYELLVNGSAIEAERTPERANFAGLIADLNPGGILHPSDGLFLYEVTDSEDSLGYNTTARIVTFALEITAQSGDPGT